MRRRTVIERHPMPGKLATYCSTDWEGPHEAARMSAWADSRRAWGDSLNLDVIPGSDYAIPDEPWDPDLL